MIIEYVYLLLWYVLVIYSLWYTDIRHFLYISIN